MSSVTNVMVTGIVGDAETISKKISKVSRGQIKLEFIDNCLVGGNKSLEGTVLIGAFNFLNLKLFCASIKKTKCDLYYCQVMLKNQDDYLWKVHLFNDLILEVL